MTIHATDPRIHLAPTTRLGRWSVGLFGLSIGALLVFYAMCAAGQRGGDTFFDNWLLTGPILVVAAAAVTGLFVGVVAIVRRHERGLALVVPILWDLFVISFALGEVVSPH